MPRPAICYGLLPLAALYGLAVAVRNRLFDRGVLRARSYGFAVISVGNLTVGGTGKTPHIEYLVRLLRRHARVAVLSRGYKRRSSGFVLADAATPMSELGDEPYQMHRKFPDVQVAVCANRREGIERLTAGLTAAEQKEQVVLLDDAFQHRYVKPGLQILLIDYNRPIWRDALLPAGRLREPVAAKARAQIVVVTKCPPTLKPIDYRNLTKALGLFPYQSLFFSTMRYGRPWPVFGGAATFEPAARVLLIVGIARPEPLIDELQQRGLRPTTLRFADHHNYTPRDAARMNHAFSALCAEGPAVALTTEKDAARLSGPVGAALSPALKGALYALPIEVEFLRGAGPRFNEKILSYVAEYH